MANIQNGGDQTMRKLGVAIGLILVIVPVVLAQEIPPLPEAFYGTVKDANGNPAPIGSIVIATVNNTEVGRIKITKAGFYGNADPGKPKLIVQGYIEDGAPITFYVNGIKAVETASFESGEVEYLNLTIPTAWPSISNPPVNVSYIPINAKANTLITIKDKSIGIKIDLTPSVDIINKNITISLYSKPINPTQDPGKFGLISLGKFYDIHEYGFTSSDIKSVTITIYYTDDEVSAKNVNENNLRIFWWNGSSWVPLPGGVDTANNYVWANTTHLSVFAVLATSATPTPTPTPTPTSTPTAGGGGIAGGVAGGAAGGGGGAGGGGIIATPTPTQTLTPTPKKVIEHLVKTPTPTITKTPPAKPTYTPTKPPKPKISIPMNIIALAIVIFAGLAVAIYILRVRR